MQRQRFVTLAAAVFGSAVGLAQDGDLSGVTMRVLDDLGGVDAVVIELDTSGRDDEGAETDAPGARAEPDAGAEPDAAGARDTDAEGDRLEQPPDSDEPR